MAETGLLSQAMNPAARILRFYYLAQVASTQHKAAQKCRKATKLRLDFLLKLLAVSCPTVTTEGRSKPRRDKNNSEEEARPGQARPGQARPGQARTGRDGTGRDGTGRDGTGRDRTGQRTELDRTGQRTELGRYGALPLVRIAGHSREIIATATTPQTHRSSHSVNMSGVPLLTPPEGSALQCKALCVRNIDPNTTINRCTRRCTESERDENPVSCKTFQNAR